MSRNILPADRIDEGVRELVASEYADTMQEVIHAVESEPIVVIGMEFNPHCVRARKALKSADVDFTYLSYGGYTREWRRRTAIKMWSGWQTYPQVFVKGVLIGGATELINMLESGQLSERLKD